MDAQNSTGTDLSARTIVVTREIDAPRELVFDAWTDPGHLARWWGPNGFSTTTSAFDMRPGGVWRFVMHGPDGRDYQNRITYKEIARPGRIVYRHGGGDDVEPVTMLTTVTFEDAGGRTRLTIHQLYPTAEHRDFVARTYRAEEGGQQTLGRLAEYLAADMFVITRTFDAPRTLVWKAWSEAGHLAHWWGPKGFGCDCRSLDFRPGGVFHYRMHTPAGQEMWGKFVYREIKAPERLVFVQSFSDENAGTTRAPFAADWPLEVLNVLTLVEQGGKTILTLKGGPINATDAERARYRSWHAPMRGGFGGTLDQLADYLGGMAVR